jgi:hypothetical protein
MFPRKVDLQDPFLAVWRLVSSDRRIRHLAEESLALIGNASGQDAEGAGIAPGHFR